MTCGHISTSCVRIHMTQHLFAFGLSVTHQPK
jgi:hypothetical protein